MKHLGIASFLANKFGASEKDIRAYLHKGPRRYRIFEIPKRNGNGNRTIAQPTRALKIMQKLVMSEYLSALPVHTAAMAYTRGKGIGDNASAHQRNSYLLKMDFKDFFPSIGKIDFLLHLATHLGPLSPDEQNMLTNLFLYKPYRNASPILSIGAPSSPFISNTILYRFDELVEQHCGSKGMTYTRYADDLIFSSNAKNALYSIPTEIESICSKLKYPRLVINSDKTVFSSKSKNRHITGLVITNENTVSIGRNKKRHIKSLVHQFKNSSLDAEKTSYLRGYLSFVKGVEPNFIDALKRKYGTETINQIMNTIS